MIRKANLDDINYIIKLEIKLFTQSLGYNFLKNEIENNPFSNILVYTKSNIIIGYIGYRAVDKNAELLNFLIDTNYQHQGYGTKLFDYCINDLKNKGVKDLVLEVRKNNQQALNFYDKYNASIINIIPNYYIDEDAYVLNIKI